MLKKICVVFLVLSFAVIGYGKPDPVADLYPNYDNAPGAVPGSSQGTDEQWDLLYAWEDMEAQSGDNGMLGICFDGTSLWVSGRGVTTANMIYMFDPASGAMTDSWPTGTTSGWGVRDMCTDGTFIYGGEDGGLHVFDMTAHIIVSTIPWPGGFSFQRANAYDPATDHFYAGNFGSTCYEQDRNGVLIRQWPPAPLVAVYGMAWDNDAPDGPWLWVHDQTTPVSGCNVHQLDPVTLTYTGVWVTLDVPPAPADMAGGLHYCSGIDPVYTTMLVFNQGVPDAGAAFEMHIDTPLTAPAAPSDFVLQASGADLIATLAWVNPTLTLGGDPLTDLIGMKIERNGEVIEDITPAVPGAAMDYFDFTVPFAGMFNYSVYGYNADNGVPVSDGVWIGLDVPAAPGGVSSMQNGANIDVTWDDPTGSLHGGYFPAGSWDGQKVYSNGNLLADLTGANSYSYDPGYTGTYTLSVVYYNASGDGGEGSAPPLSYVGPPQYMISEIAYDWVDISTIGTNTGIHADDIVGGPFPVGFDFPYFAGELFNQIWVSSNGFFTFTANTLSDYTNNPIPDPTLPNCIVAPFWDDLNLSTSGNIYYYYDAANSRFILSYDAAPMYSGGGTATFQTYLYEDGTVEVMFNALTGNINSCTVGMENSDGSDGIQATYNNSGPYNPPAANYGLRFGEVVAYDVDITLTPASLPIVIPAGGGSFDFNIEATNNELIPVVIGAWTMITYPGGIFGPVINVSGFPIGASASAERDRTQAIPAGAPSGAYTYDAYVGVYPSVIWGEDHFDFTKAADGDGFDYGDWYCWGEAFPGEIITAPPDMPVSFSLSKAYPNPFNPVATIGYTLADRSQVELVVYDVTGREVATLVNTVMNAGTYNAVFQADGLASGVYFYRLTAGDFTAVNKMILMK